MLLPFVMHTMTTTDHSAAVCVKDTCDWIWENPASTHMQLQIFRDTEFNYLKYYNSGREADACMKSWFYSYL